MNHPLPMGARIRTLLGEMDEGEEGERSCPPGSVGTVISVDKYGEPPQRQGWCYGVQFYNPDGKSGPWVFLDQLDSIDDESKYQLVED